MLRIFGQIPPILSSSMGQLERLEHIPRPAIARDLRSPLASSLSEARGLLDWLEESPCKRFHLPPAPQPRRQKENCIRFSTRCEDTNGSLATKQKRVHKFSRTKWPTEPDNMMTPALVTTWEWQFMFFFLEKCTCCAIVFATRASSLSWPSGLMPAC